jgi:hypothetical protein
MPDWMDDLFSTLDKMDANGFASYLTDDALFKFGNADPVNGKTNIRDAVAGFLSSIAGFSHKLVGKWQVGDRVFLQGEVTYIRKDKSKLTVPFFNLFKMKGNLIQEYLIYIDNSQLYR